MGTMARILILFSTHDGQTKRVAARFGETLAAMGHEVTRVPAEEPGAFELLASHDAVIVGAAIRYGRHSRALVARVKEHRARIASMPNAFFSVCLSAGGPGAKPETAEAYIRDFRARTGWDSTFTASFAGALRYREYKPLVRLMTRFVVAVAGGDTDTSRDYEYTDWAAVERFATAFGRSIAPRAIAA